jgi:hypothetical protein
MFPMEQAVLVLLTASQDQQSLMPLAVTETTTPTRR